MKEPETDLQKDGSHRNPKNGKHIVRFPRLIRRYCRRTAEDVAFYRTAHRFAELEAKAFDWIARGRPANIELGRVFNQIKALLKHGEWKPYFAKKFAPRGIHLRTATDYMAMARQDDEITKKADSALFPPATDPQAVEIREATARHRAAVARAKSSSSEAASSDAETDHCERAKDPEGSMCTCRLQIRMSKENHARVLALWRSRNRALAETAVAEFLLELCAKYEIDESASEEESGA
jgi:hypothetical protein